MLVKPKLKWHLAFFQYAQTVFMNLKLKSDWFMFRLLLLVNAILICVILLMHVNIKHTGCINDAEKTVRSLSGEAVNSVTIKLM